MMILCIIKMRSSINATTHIHIIMYTHKLICTCIYKHTLHTYIHVPHTHTQTWIHAYTNTHYTHTYTHTHRASYSYSPNIINQRLICTAPPKQVQKAVI